MSDVILCFTDESDGTTLDGEDVFSEGDLPVPRKGELVHIGQTYRVLEVLYDLGNGQVDKPHVWVTLESVEEGPNPNE